MARKQFLSFLLIFSLLISCASALAETDDDDDWDDNVDDAWEMEHPLHSGDYAYALLTLLKGERVVREMKKGMMYND